MLKTSLVRVSCTHCRTETSAVRLGNGPPRPPPGWGSLSPTCCPGVELIVCDNVHCRELVAFILHRKHSDKLTFTQLLKVPVPGVDAPAHMTISTDLMTESRG